MPPTPISSEIGLFKNVLRKTDYKGQETNYKTNHSLSFIVEYLSSTKRADHLDNFFYD